MQIKLSWQDPNTNAPDQIELSLPIAIGKELAYLPSAIADQPVSPLVLQDGSVSRYHALITIHNGKVQITDQNSTNGLLINNVRHTQAELVSGDIVAIGRFCLTISLPQSIAPTLVSVPEPQTITLRWENQTTGEQYQRVCPLPVVLGRELPRLPSAFNGLPTTPIVLESLQVSRYHAAIACENQQVYVIDQNSSGGTFLNGCKIARSPLKSGDVLQIGGYDIAVILTSPATQVGTPPTQLVSTPATILFAPSGELTSSSQSSEAPAVGESFPPALFQNPIVAVQDLRATGLPVDETTYGGVGAGLGSFIWIDYLRIGGVKAEEIAAIGLEPEPYARYKRLCLNSQIPLHERLRSNSDSCPDNIWGYPSYAWREAWRDCVKGDILKALYYLWQVFAEPALAETYTPRSGNVFDSIDREAQRIGWDKIYRYGRVRAIRKTTDGRYAIAYSLGKGKHGFWLTRYLHLAVGYAAIQFLPDLQAYRETTKDFRAVVNAYEEHDHVYEQLEQQGGTVLLRGRGIVASRIVQRIYEARAKNKDISILHLMRSPKPQGNKFGRAQRVVENHYEFQPFNWPKACWGGDLLQLLENSDDKTRQELLATWGGTTTASRADWRRIVKEGLAQGWYQIVFGVVQQVEPTPDGKTITTIQGKGVRGTIQLTADFIIDATGLDAKIMLNPLYADLVETYQLPINFLGRLKVTNDFELLEMRNERGRMYAAGAATLGGPHAAVDSFLGLQFACLRSVDSLYKLGAPHLKKINGWYSLMQWLKWVANQPPT